MYKRQPEGYRTNIGDRGVKLSGGQRQRLSLSLIHISTRPETILGDTALCVNPNDPRYASLPVDARVIVPLVNRSWNVSLSSYPSVLSPSTFTIYLDQIGNAIEAPCPCSIVSK